MLHNKNRGTQCYIVFSKCYFCEWTMLPKNLLSTHMSFLTGLHTPSKCGHAHAHGVQQVTLRLQYYVTWNTVLHMVTLGQFASEM